MSSLENASTTLKQVVVEKEKPKGAFDTFRILILAMGHLVNDSYSNIVPPLLPMLKAAYGLSYAASGMLTTVYTITSSIVQPLFGYYADKHGRRWLVALSTAWVAFFMSLIGVVSYLGLDSSGSYIVLLTLIALAGFGNAAYHPQGASMVPRVSGDHKGLGVSIFSAGGNLGYAITPLLVVPATALWGLKGTLVFLIPGFLMSLLLYRYAPEAPQTGAHLKVGELIRDITSVIKPLLVVTGIVVMRAWVFFGLITFLPLYFALRNEAPVTASVHLFVLLLFGAIGGLIGGAASDRYGRKFVIVTSLVITGPLLYLALSTSGLVEWALTAMAGAALLASFSPAVLIAQDLIPNNQGIASGLILGLAIGIGGLGVSVTGAFADAFGLTAAVYSLVLLPVMAMLFALALPGSIRPRLG
ncbi:MFS transporter [Methanocella paludicola SANAE]|uniref:MFS transporter n=1 Tax=Methanocella paludicola (strain DSM 17711 / JCM 13418 / NBRC 101707 / SANAE) TaxID=304371 RepID=D1Z2I3_METPS|nr:MFS transporter [Methanocella paludicola]BAI62905.1 MFS transporter [Methanocella paludicola SANAE]